MKHNILIYGLGNIGFRHAQSLINDKGIGKIFIYDHKKKIIVSLLKNLVKKKNLFFLNLKK